LLGIQLGFKMTHLPEKGVVAPILTPFRSDLSVDIGRFVDNAARCLADGCVGLAPFGTTGEALSVGIDERMTALEALVAGGIEAGRLIPGTGLTSLADTARLTRHAVEQGCAGAMVLPPFYYKGVSADGLYAYFARLIETVGDPRLKLYLYHIPQVAGVGIPVDVVRRLRSDFPQTIVGIKDSSGDWANTRSLLEIEGLTVYPGSELVLIEAMALGAPGCISATANLNAAAIAKVIQFIAAGEHKAAADAFAGVKAFRLKLQAAAPIPAQKRLLAIATGHADWALVRPPLDSMDAAAGKRLADELAREFDFVAAAA
jgi:4-hydroxy-tetrahydrodipicolinate synthase